jgi:hypothetical protein
MALLELEQASWSDDWRGQDFDRKYDGAMVSNEDGGGKIDRFNPSHRAPL